MKLKGLVFFCVLQSVFNGVYLSSVVGREARQLVEDPAKKTIRQLDVARREVRQLVEDPAKKAIRQLGDEVHTDVGENGPANTDYANARPIIDNGGLDPNRRPINAGPDMKAKPVDLLEKVVNGLLMPGPAIIQKVNETQSPAADTVKDAGQTISASGNMMAAPNNMMAAPNNMMAAPNNMKAAPNNMMAAPSNMVAAPNNKMAAPSNMMAAPSNKMEAPSNMMAAPSNKMEAPSNMMAAPGNLTTAPNNVAPPNNVPSNVVAAPSNFSAASSKLTTAPSNGLTAPSNGLAAPSNGMAAPSNGLAAPSNGMAAPSNGLAAPSNGVAAPSNGLAGPSSVVAGKNNVAAQSNLAAAQSDLASAQSNVVATPSNNTIARDNASAPIVVNTEVAINKTVVGENIKASHADTGSVKDDGHVSLEGTGNWKMTGNEAWLEDDNANVKASKSKEENGDGGKVLQDNEKTVGDYKESTNDEDNGDFDFDDDDDVWWKDDDDDDYYDKWFNDDDDDDWLEDSDDDDLNDLESDDDDFQTTTTKQAWFSTTNEGDYDFDEEDDEDDKIEAGKELMGSVHNFDSGLGAFAGAKVSSKGSLSNGSVYSWTLLLMICVVLIGLFIFWNRHKVEKYIVSLRHPMPNGKNGAQRDEEENLIENEYA